jgi:hypothetical protein
MEAKCRNRIMAYPSHPPTEEEFRVLQALHAGTFDGTEPAVILCLSARGCVASDEGNLKITESGIAALSLFKSSTPRQVGAPRPHPIVEDE